MKKPKKPERETSVTSLDVLDGKFSLQDFIDWADMNRFQYDDVFFSAKLSYDGTKLELRQEQQELLEHFKKRLIEYELELAQYNKVKTREKIEELQEELKELEAKGDV